MQLVHSTRLILRIYPSMWTLLAQMGGILKTISWNAKDWIASNSCLNISNFQAVLLLQDNWALKGKEFAWKKKFKFFGKLFTQPLSLWHLGYFFVTFFLFLFVSKNYILNFILSYDGVKLYVRLLEWSSFEQSWTIKPRQRAMKGPILAFMSPLKYFLLVSV